MLQCFLSGAAGVNAVLLATRANGFEQGFARSLEAAFPTYMERWLTQHKSASCPCAPSGDRGPSLANVQWRAETERRLERGLCLFLFWEFGPEICRAGSLQQFAPRTCIGSGTCQGKSSESEPCNTGKCSTAGDPCTRLRNKIDNATCGTYANYGYCNGLYKQYMDMNCKAACCKRRNNRNTSRFISTVTSTWLTWCAFKRSGAFVDASKTVRRTLPKTCQLLETIWSVFIVFRRSNLQGFWNTSELQFVQHVWLMST